MYTWKRYGAAGDVPLISLRGQELPRQLGGWMCPRLRRRDERCRLGCYQEWLQQGNQRTLCGESTEGGGKGGAL